MAKVFKISMRDGKKSSAWYGKLKVAEGKWSRVKLYTDKVASERKLVELQRDADRRAAGVRTVDMDHASRPISEHATDYIEALRLEKRDPESIRIAKWQLDYLVGAAAWSRLSDITSDGVRRVIAALDKKGRAAAHQNTFIKRAKAFVHWLQREGRLVGDPLANLKRVDETHGKRTRARRALSAEESIALLQHAPEDRRLKYAFAILAGLRRSELAELLWDDLRLNAPKPFIQLRPEQTKNGKADILPLHPYLVLLLRDLDQGAPHSPVVSSVPDMKTMVKDLKRAGVEPVDARGLRADFHALRHTYCTNLDATGASDATKRALMRHADGGVTQRYSHARHAELYAAIERLPAPTFAEPIPAVSADAGEGGTGDSVDHQLDQSMVTQGQNEAPDGTEGIRDLVLPIASCQEAQPGYNPGVGNERHPVASQGTQIGYNSFKYNNLGPSTQVV